MKDSFIFHLENAEDLEELTLEEKGQIFDAMILFTQTGQEMEFEDRALRIAFKPILRRLKADAEAYQARCDANKANGKKGGRPSGKSQLTTISGEIVPDGEVEGKHFLYLLHDNYTGEYKIGETQNLKQRRYDIKKPTNNLDVVAFKIEKKAWCIQAESDILKEYRSNRINGDWLSLNEKEVDLLVSKWFLKKPSGLFADSNIPKKPDSETDTDSDTDIYINNILSGRRKEIVDYLNEKTGKHFSPTSAANVRFIDSRLKEGRTVEDFKRVIDNKVADWKDTEQDQYLRPETLFTASHFESYLNQRKVKSRQRQTISADMSHSYDMDELRRRAKE